MGERKINCLNCNNDGSKENVVQDGNLISYTCTNCGSWVFDKLEDEDHFPTSK